MIIWQEKTPIIKTFCSANNKILDKFNKIVSLQKRFLDRKAIWERFLGCNFQFHSKLDTS